MSGDNCSRFYTTNSLEGTPAVPACANRPGLYPMRDLPGSHEYLRAGQDCANLGRVPFARRPTGMGHQTPAWPVRRLAQSAQWACSRAHWRVEDATLVAKNPGCTLLLRAIDERCKQWY